MYEQILNTLLSKTDLDKLVRELEALEDTNFEFGDDGLEKVLNTEIRQEISESIRKDLKENNITTSEYVKGLSEKLNLYRTIGLTIPFEPTRKNMEKISDWISQNIGKNILVSYEYNPYLIGGAVIVNGGEYRNFSLKKLIDNFFTEQKERVYELLSK